MALAAKGEASQPRKRRESAGLETSQSRVSEGSTPPVAQTPVRKRFWWCSFLFVGALLLARSERPRIGPMVVEESLPTPTSLSTYMSARMVTRWSGPASCCSWAMAMRAEARALNRARR